MIRPADGKSLPDLERAGAVGALKVPAAITSMFWAVKLLTTGMGEAASDWLAGGNLVVAAAIGALGFAAALAWQMRTDRYRAGVYWFAVAMVAVFGTMAADGVHLVLDLPYSVATAANALLLAGVFVVWRRREGTCSIHRINTRNRELCYWATVLVTFALGTAAGDWAAFSLDLGYRGSALLFALAMLVPAVGWWRGWLPPTVAFWAAYVLTRPLGASLADWLGKPAERGDGLGLGDGPVTIVAAGLVVVLVAVSGARMGRAMAPASGTGDGRDAPSLDLARLPGRR